ncbi:UNVERIFIED_CONTAM: hypothetical protein Sindi_2679100 [Sesamum indicum]
MPYKLSINITESRIGKCYVNAYKDRWDDLCKLFAQPVDSDSATLDNTSTETGEGDLKEPSDPTVSIEPSNPVGVAQKDPCPYGYVSDSPTSSSSLWNFCDDFYGCDDDADSLQPLPVVPMPGQKSEATKCLSPPAAQSEGQASSTALNRTPVKKGD